MGRGGGERCHQQRALPPRGARRHVGSALDIVHAFAHYRVTDLPGTASRIESTPMRFESDLLHHFGEPCDRELLFASRPAALGEAAEQGP